MAQDEYQLLVTMTVTAKDKSMVVHDPGSIADAVRHKLKNMLGSSMYSNGLRYSPGTITVEAVEVPKTTVINK
jgi:hypothetical protein